MKKIFVFFRYSLLLIVVLTILTSFSSCIHQEEKVRVSWFDADGVLIESKYVPKDYDPTKRDLPNENDKWYYVGWEISVSEDGFICQAKRKEKQHIVWEDYDGAILNEVFLLEDEDVPSFELPSPTDRWVYDNWKEESKGTQTVFRAQRSPNVDFFIGNVFQIVIKDVDGKAIGTGSGFIINDEGWFITNNHVMESASSAIAFFDIEDRDRGLKYTQLDVLGGVYNSGEKDIFIGKLANYDKIKDYYNNIDFTQEYSTGEISYTVGYPNSSVKMEINSGVILDEYSNIYDKINGIYYVLSDSYIAPGSSGGILINENFEVIGITTIGLYADEYKQVYTAGGSIPTLTFYSQLSNLDETKIKNLTNIYN